MFNKTGYPTYQDYPTFAPGYPTLHKRVTKKEILKTTPSRTRVLHEESVGVPTDLRKH